MERKIFPVPCDEQKSEFSKFWKNYIFFQNLLIYIFSFCFENLISKIHFVYCFHLGFIFILESFTYFCCIYKNIYRKYILLFIVFLFIIKQLVIFFIVASYCLSIYYCSSIGLYLFIHCSLLIF